MNLTEMLIVCILRKDLNRCNQFLNPIFKGPADSKLFQDLSCLNADYN